MKIQELVHSYSSNLTKDLDISFPNLRPFKKKEEEKEKEDENNSKNQKETYLDIDIDGEEEKQDEAEKNSLFQSKTLRKKLPILKWLPEYNVNKLISDFIAGMTVGLTLIPQGLAMASVAGLPPQYGLYSAFMGCFVYILFGSTKAITIGPTAIVAIITMTYAQGKPPEYAVLLCFATGVVTLLMGICQLGFIVNFISTPVTTAFTSAAAITIAFTQVKSLLGLQFKAEGFLDVSVGVVQHFTQVSLLDLLVSIVCTISLIVLKDLQSICSSLTKRSALADKIIWVVATSRSVIIIVTCTLVFAIIGDATLVSFVGNVHHGLPPFRMPPFVYHTPLNHTIETIHQVRPEWKIFTALDMLREDSSALVVIPLLALMEHYTSAKMFAGAERVDASQEMIAIGISNILSSFFSSMPITGSFSRTVVNKASGVETPIGGLFTGVIVIIALQFLTPWFYYIPKAALAAVICTAVILTVDFGIVKLLWRSKRMDLLPWGATFFISLILGLEYGILAGFLITIIFLLYWSARPRIRVNRGQTISGIDIIVVDLDRSLTFPSVEYSRNIIMKCGKRWANGSLPLVIDCQHIQFADSTAAMGIRDLFRSFNKDKHPLVLYRMKASVVRIVTNVLNNSPTFLPYNYCNTPQELDDILHRLITGNKGISVVKEGSRFELALAHSATNIACITTNPTSLNDNDACYFNSGFNSSDA